jgi:hypothetical protein
MQPMPRDPTAPIQPDPSAPMRLAHAAAMFGLTVSALRTEARRGRLAISRVAGKDFVTKAEVERMFERCQLAPKAPDCGSGPPEPRTAATNELSGSSATESINRARDATLATVKRLKEGSRPTSPVKARRL